MDLNARRPEVETAIDEAMDNCITETYLNETIPSLGPKRQGGLIPCICFSTCDLLVASPLVPCQALQSLKYLIFYTAAEFLLCLFTNVMNSNFHGLVADQRHI